VVKVCNEELGEGEGADGEISTEGNIIIKTQRQKKG